MSGALPSAGPARSPRRMRPRGRANEASRSWGGDPRAQWDPTARYDPTARRGRGKAAGPSPSTHAEVLTRPFPVSQRISHLSYRPLAPVSYRPFFLSPSRTSPAPGRPPRPRTVRAGGARPSAAPRCQPQPGGCSGLPRQPRFLPLPGPRGAFARFRFCSQEGTTSERAVPGDGAEPPGSRIPPGSPSLPLTRPHLPANRIGARGSQRQSRAPSPAAQGPPVPQQDPRAPPEVLAAGSRGGREGLHSPAGSAPTCRAISHWGGAISHRGGPPSWEVAQEISTVTPSIAATAPGIRSGSQRYRPDRASLALTSPGSSGRSEAPPAPKRPVCCEGGQLGPQPGWRAACPAVTAGAGICKVPPAASPSPGQGGLQRSRRGAAPGLRAGSPSLCPGRSPLLTTQLCEQLAVHLSICPSVLAANSLA